MSWSPASSSGKSSRVPSTSCFAPRPFGISDVAVNGLRAWPIGLIVNVSMGIPRPYHKGYRSPRPGSVTISTGDGFAVVPPRGGASMRKTLVALALIAGLAGCGEDKVDSNGNPVSPDAPPATIALVTVSANPVSANPVFVPAQASGDPNFPWIISW